MTIEITFERIENKAPVCFVCGMYIVNTGMKIMRNGNAWASICYPCATKIANELNAPAKPSMVNNTC